MKTLAKYYVCNHCLTGKKTFTNILIRPSKLPGLSRNGPLIRNRNTNRRLNNVFTWIFRFTHQAKDSNEQNPCL